jgi:hypothetical protein
MGWVRRQWTPEGADGWSLEDLLASLLSSLSYILLIVGSALALLAQPLGYLLLLGGFALAAAMYYVIDPKLRAVSSDYEAKQKHYLERLEKLTRWEKSE